MPVEKIFNQRVFPMPSRIEISFKSYVGETLVPDISKPIVKYYFQEYDKATGKSQAANVLQLLGTDLTPEDLETVMDIFVKYFDRKYTEKYL